MMFKIIFNLCVIIGTKSLNVSSLMRSGSRFFFFVFTKTLLGVRQLTEEEENTERDEEI